MRRYTLVAALLAACRLDFDARVPGEAGVEAGADAIADAAPQGLACNTPVKLASATAANPLLSAVATDRGVFAVWLDDAGNVISSGAVLPAPDTALAIPLGFNAGPWSSVSIAVNGTRLLAAIGTTDVSATGSSFLHPFDIVTGQSAGDPVMQRIRVATTRGLAPAGTGFVLAGTSFVPGNEVDLVIVDDDGVMAGNATSFTTTPAGARVARLDATGFVVVAWGPSIACTARIGRAVGTLGPRVTWGTSGMCVDPAAIPSADASHVLLIRKDTADGDLNYQIATVTGNTIGLVGDGKLTSVSDDPRGAPTGGIYWVGYRTAAGQLEVNTVDAGSVKGTPHTIAPTPTLDSHDVVVFAGEPYALFFDSGLWLAHLCP